jgi:hypothetical protein
MVDGWMIGGWLIGCWLLVVGDGIGIMRWGIGRWVGGTVGQWDGGT